MKKLFIILSLFALVFSCFVGRYEYTQYPNGKIHQRINRFTGDVEIFCCTKDDFCVWREGNNCARNTISEDELRTELIIDRLVNGESITNINRELETYKMKPFSEGELELTNIELEKSAKKPYDRDDAESYYK